MKLNRLAKDLTLLATAAFAMMTVTPARAAELNGKIPFDFFAGEKKLPAGDYKVSIQNGSIVLRGANVASPAHAFTNSNHCESPAVAIRPKLVFRRVGAHHFLAQVWMGNPNWGRETNQSRAEKTLREEVRAKVAGTTSQMGTAEVALGLQ